MEEKNPFKQARLDYFLTSNTLTDLIDNCEIQPGYRSDHSIVKLEITTNHFTIGRGTWKFNNSLLHNPNYLSLVNQIIQEEKFKYSLPVYSKKYIEENFQDISFTITDESFLEMLLLRIRGETIKFSSHLKRKQNQKEKYLIADIAHLENTQIGQTNMTLLEDKKIELENLRKEKINGQIIRARMQWLNEGEKPSRFFCKLESRHFVEKTIRKLKTNTGSTITDQKKILSEIESFYKDLFKRDQSLPENFNYAENIARLGLKSVNEKHLGDLLSTQELGTVLKNMKNNKSPGIDGISADFLKLKHFVCNALNSCYSNGILSVSMRQSIITCIPKGNKDRSQIKNWRPISLLTVPYKLASSSIARRLKSILDNIISKTQSGFISGRSISDCTRLIYDLMFYTQKHKIPGLLMQIDFQKAFDSVSWKFLYSVLENFGFDEKFINWIKLFNNDISAYVLQCGFLSRPISIQRGCRQGDPIAPYLFLLAAEVLSCMIKNSKDISGLLIGTNVYKIAQFADDTTLILNGDANSLQATLNILEVFGNLSGLKMNSEKTKLIWIGSKHGSKEKLDVSHSLQWGESQFNLLGIKFCSNLEEMPHLNFKEALQKAKQVLNPWRSRYLTPLGKISVIKTMVLSKFIHLLMTLPTPENTLTDISKMFFNFIWEGKPDKINRDQICRSYQQGGLKMTNIFTFEKSMKIKWLKEVIVKTKKDWIQLLSQDININKLMITGTIGFKSQASKKNCNPFWKDVFKYYSDFRDQLKIKCNEDIMSICIWLNKNVGTESILFLDWLKVGIHSIGDILNSQGILLSMNDIQQRYNFRINFLNYYTLKRKLNLLSKNIKNHPLFSFQDLIYHII